MLQLGVQSTTTSRKPLALIVLSLIGLVALGRLLSGFVGVALTVQIVVTLLVPTLIMILYWRVARRRVLANEAELGSQLELERVVNRATGELLLGVAHELRLHPQRCSLRAEALAVAVDYRHVTPDLKVAVPDATIVSDPYLLRQILHILVGNAVRHGGLRVAIWASVDEQSVRITVSDDGEGIPAAIGAQAFGRLVDLAEPPTGSRTGGTGLPLARTLSEMIGSSLTYKRDATWTHFSMSLPLASGDERPVQARVPLEAGVH
jgi:hypothetical protein